MYNSEISTFFTPVGELGFALHEMFEVSDLSIGEVSYEEYIPTAEESKMLKAGDEHIYQTYWKMMCHYHICADLAGVRNQRIGHKKWADYLFINLKESLHMVRGCPSISIEEVKERISSLESTSYTTEPNEGGSGPGTVFQSFHYQAQFSISDKGLLVGFLMFWLKRCVVPSLPKEVIAKNVVYPAILLAYGRPFGLLPEMVAWALCNIFMPAEKNKGKAGKGKAAKEAVTMKTPNPRVEMPYTYLMDG